VAGHVRVVVATDLHELAPALHDDGPAYHKFATTGAGRDIEGTEALLDTFEKDVRALAPDWILLTGDLTNNGERESHRALAARLGRLAQAGLRVLVIPGNHDIANPFARAFAGDRQRPTPSVSAAEFADLYRDFGYGPASVRDPASLSYRVVAGPGLWFLMLDDNLYAGNAAAGAPITGGRVSEATQAWIRGQAAEAQKAGARLVVAEHHNLFYHSPVIAEGFTLDNTDAVQQLYAEVGVRLVLSGHIHIQDAVAHLVAGELRYDIAGNALSVHPHQFGRLDFDLARGRARYDTQKLSMGSAYDRASEEAFERGARTLALRNLPGVSPAEAAAAADTMALLNLRYFAGTEALNAADVVGSAGYRTLVERGSGFLPVYAESILADDETDDNHLEFAY